MAINRVKPTNWNVGDILTATEITQLDKNAASALDKRKGFEDTLESIVTIKDTETTIDNTAVHLSNGSTIQVNDNSMVKLNNGGSVYATGGNINVSTGSEINLQGSGKINATSANSSINIQNGAKLNVDDAEININRTTVTIDDLSSILIKQSIVRLADSPLIITDNSIYIDSNVITNSAIDMLSLYSEKGIDFQTNQTRVYISDTDIRVQNKPDFSSILHINKTIGIIQHMKSSKMSVLYDDISGKDDITLDLNKGNMFNLRTLNPVGNTFTINFNIQYMDLDEYSPFTVFYIYYRSPNKNVQLSIPALDITPSGLSSLPNDMNKGHLLTILHGRSSSFANNKTYFYDLIDYKSWNV